MEISQADTSSFGVPDYIDEAARSEPDATWAIIPASSTSIEEGWHHSTFSELAKAVDDVAWWIEENVGVPDPAGQTICYMGENDPNYFVVLAATLKAGYVPLFVSPRNSDRGNVSVLERTKCEVILTRTEVTAQMREKIPHVRVIRVSFPVERGLFKPKCRCSSYTGRHSRNGSEHSIVLHTSGSTGLPKPVYLTLQGLNTIYQQGSLPKENGLEHTNQLLIADRRPMLAAVPFFHAMGIVVGLRSLMCRGTIVTLPSKKIMSSSLVIDAINAIHPATGIFPPSILEDISASEAGVQAMGQLERVFFGGAPLANASGDIISQVTRLQTIIGSTEALLICSLLPTRSDEWCYFQWSAFSGASMEPASDGLFELVLKRRDVSYQAIFHNFPEKQEWRTRDLFTPHPYKPFLWKYSGRQDDIIVLSNGEKVNPVAMEKLIESHPNVDGALVVGQGKFQTGLLIEARSSEPSVNHSSLKDQIWPLVEQANREAPGHAEIHRTMIVVANKGKRFHRVSKGSILRMKTISDFQDEIDHLYAAALRCNNPNQRVEDETSLRARIRAVTIATLHYLPHKISDDTDIFDFGIDSLDVLALTTALNTSIHGVNILPVTVYSYPTINKLCTELSHSVQKSKRYQTYSPSREERLSGMVRKYTKDVVRLNKIEHAAEHPPHQTVLLTGSTGSLGSHVLEQLLGNPSVERVYCLNRSDNAETRHRNSFNNYHHFEADFTKVTFLKADLGCADFGLSGSAYADLLSTVTALIHSAWCVDFNLSLESFEAVHLAGTRRVMEFAAASLHRPCITFVSSIASVGNWGSIVNDGSAVPESTTTLFDSTIVLDQGYGESKYVAARILAVLSHRLGIRTAIVRASQLAGPSASANGAPWNRHEWLPAMIHTSKILGKIPRTLGYTERVDWLPMDIAARTIIDFATAPAAEPTQVYHLANPQTTTWGLLYPTIQDFFKETNMEVVEYQDWVEELKQIPYTRENVERIPGLKLLSFYSSLLLGLGIGLPVLETNKAQAISKALRDARAVDKIVMRKWLEQWTF